MHIDHAPRRQIEHLRPQDVTIRDDDAKIGLETAEAGSKDVAHGAYRLQYRYPCRKRGDLDWWGDQLGAGPALRLVRLGNDTRDRESALQQCLERWHGKSRGTEENDSHHSDRADAAWTSLVYRVSSLCSRRQRASSIWRLRRLR